MPSENSYTAAPEQTDTAVKYMYSVTGDTHDMGEDFRASRIIGWGGDGDAGKQINLITATEDKRSHEMMLTFATVLALITDGTFTNLLNIVGTQSGALEAIQRTASGGGGTRH